MSEFDDRELEDALRRRAGAATDGFGLEAARSAVVARAARVRRRRATVAGGAVMAGLVAVAVFVIGPGTDSVVTTPADQSNEPPSVSVVTSVDADATVPTNVQVTTVDTEPASTPPTPATTTPSAAPSTNTAPSTVAPAPPSTTVAAPTPAPPVTPPTSATTPGGATVPGPAPFDETYSSTGGSITVHWDGAALSLTAVTPADDFDPEVEDQRADRIRVRFRGDDGDVRIEIRFQNGQVVRVE